MCVKIQTWQLSHARRKSRKKIKSELRYEKSNDFLCIHLYTFFLYDICDVFICMFLCRVSEVLISISLKFPINDSDNPFTIYLVSHSISFRYIVDVEKPRAHAKYYIFALSVLFNQSTFFAWFYFYAIHRYFIFHIEKIYLRDLIAYT